MAKLTSEDIRNVALVGHNSSGKTTLADAMLFKAKAVTRRGQVADGTSVFDYEEEERERHVTIELAVATAPHKGKLINILDTPGYYDFCGEAICALNAAEIAAVCVNAVDGVMVNTRKMWEQAGAVGCTRILLVNKCDADNANVPALLARLRVVFGPACVPLQLPDGPGAALKSVFSVLRPPEGLAPDTAALVSEAKEKLMECDDALLEKYLEGAEVKPEEVEKILPGAILEGKIVPILCLSAEKDVGLKELMDFIVDVLPSPAGAWKRRGGDEWKSAGDPSAPFSGQVFKSLADRHVGRLALIKCISGTIKPDVPLTNARTEQTARMGGLFKPFGKEQKPLTEAIPGDICCVSKIEDLVASDTVKGNGSAPTYPRMAFPAPMVSQAVSPKSKQDEQRLSTCLQRLADSDPTFRLTRDQQSSELVVTAMSQMHMDINIIRLKRKFEVEVLTKLPKIPYRETISKPADGHHRHKKQTGGHGQFAEVFLRLEPLPRDSSYEFVDEIKQGRIPNQFIPSVDKGIQETLAKGIVAQCPVVDVRVRLVDGKYHEVDSDNRSFAVAGSKAFKGAFLEAKPVLLEPIVNLEVVVPAKYMGDITGDLNARRGRIQGMDADGDNQVIRAQVPLMEIQSYSTELRSMTGGEGWYSFTPSHYDVLPAHIAQTVIAQNQKKEAEEDEA